MQSSGWIALLRHIPVEQQSRFMLVTASGTEITIQSLLLIEQEFVCVKGRLSGTQDTGRVFFIPYPHIDYFGYAQPVRDEEFNQMFGDLRMPAASAVPFAPAPALSMEVPPPPPLPEPSVASPPPPSGSRPSIRSEVLERFRSRPGSPASSPSLPNPRPAQP